VNAPQIGTGKSRLGELAQIAAAGDRQAIRTIKMIKQAVSQGKGEK
jgi:hypothetical protein